MAHVSGTFSSASAGKLRVTLNGTFYQNTYRDAGFPSSSGGVGNWAVRAYVGPSGSYGYTEPIDRYAPTSVKEFDYPGGNVTWNIGTETLAYVDPTGGIWFYGMSKISVQLVLQKR
jgi:hypothetical protein